MYLACLERYVYCIYDYVHIFKNIQNNWITVVNQQSSFEKDGVSYVAAWCNICALHEEDQKLTLSMTKIISTGFYLKPLQGQSVPLVYHVFKAHYFLSDFHFFTK